MVLILYIFHDNINSNYNTLLSSQFQSNSPNDSQILNTVNNKSIQQMNNLYNNIDSIKQIQQSNILNNNIFNANESKFLKPIETNNNIDKLQIQQELINQLYLKNVNSDEKTNNNLNKLHQDQIIQDNNSINNQNLSNFSSVSINNDNQIYKNDIIDITPKNIESNLLSKINFEMKKDDPVEKDILKLGYQNKDIENMFTMSLSKTLRQENFINDYEKDVKLESTKEEVQSQPNIDKVDNTPIVSIDTENKIDIQTSNNISDNQSNLVEKEKDNNDSYQSELLKFTAYTNANFTDSMAEFYSKFNNLYHEVVTILHNKTISDKKFK